MTAPRTRKHADPGRRGDGNSIMAPPTPDPIAVTEFDLIDRVAGRWTAGALWTFYERTFTAVNEMAAQRHLMTYAEFCEVLLDDRITKYIARSRRDETLVGLSVMTDDLEAWTLVAPEFFKRVWRDRPVFYVGFVAAAGAPGAYAALVAKMYERVIAVDGIAVMDFCDHNVQRLGIVRKVDVLLKRINPNARGAIVDSQHFHAWDFRGDA